ncbi:hypothetical protein WJX73_006438 [Symbiochloris irregularis]|uniref:Ubiquitin-like domain-containing protein n=1 Tax=Symbiochloris irregularis TaxID=706552 RepID=A0AAW1NUZ8_9CHLO
MDLFVKNLQGRTLQIRLPASATIAEVKAAIEDAEGTTYDRQRLIYAGKQLEDERTLAAYNIGKEATLHMLLRLAG